MNIKKVKEVLKLFLNGKQPVVPFLLGKPGIGKSAIVNQVAEENNFQFIDLRLSQLDSCDVRGIPRVDKEKGVSKWFPPEFLPFKGIEKFEESKGILFLDEINRARPDVLQSIFQLVYDRKVGEYDLLDDWYIVAAGNLGIEDGTDVIEFDSALKNRFVYIDVDYNLADWVSWATENNVHNTIIGFLQSRPEYLYHQVTEDEKKYLTPRTWHMFSNLLNNNKDIDPEEIVGKIGMSFIDGATAMFLKYLQDNRIPTAKEVLTNYSKTKTRIQKLGRDMIYQLNNELLLHIKDTVEQLKDKTKKKYYTNLKEYIEDNLESDNCIAFVKAASEYGESTVNFVREFFDTNDDLNKKLFDSYFNSL